MRHGACGKANGPYSPTRPAWAHPASDAVFSYSATRFLRSFFEPNTPYLNHGIEKEIKNASKAGKHLAISVVPHYGNEGSGIPTEIENNYSVLEDDETKHCVVEQNPANGMTRGGASCPRR